MAVRRTLPGMAEVTVIANLPVLGLRKNQQITIELTDLIQGALDGGKLSLVEPCPAPESVAGPGPVAEPTKAEPQLIYICVVCKVERLDVVDGKRGIIEGAYLPECPNCGSEETPQPYVEPAKPEGKRKA